MVLGRVGGVGRWWRRAFPSLPLLRRHGLLASVPLPSLGAGVVAMAGRQVALPTFSAFVAALDALAVGVHPAPQAVGAHERLPGGAPHAADLGARVCAVVRILPAFYAAGMGLGRGGDLLGLEGRGRFRLALEVFGAMEVLGHFAEEPRHLRASVAFARLKFWKRSKW